MPFAKNYQEFMNLPEREGANTNVSCETFELSNMSFKYPNQTKYALKNINLKINKNESIAIVGENGAGKSTIVKLLMGLYLPTEGEAKIDGVQTSDIDPNYLFKNTSSVFQNFIKYKLSLKDNVYLANTKEEFNNAKFDDCIEKADFNMSGVILDNGIDTVLSKEFGNVDLSGGQWQRLAIARGLYKNYNFIVLDEPTAAIDPLEEREVYNKFIEISQNKTSIIVTHRLGSARLANRIVVMKDGEIDDIGTHNELMNKKGYYFNLFTSQAKWYI
jgi:ATP-binding cassette subfamily B protein